MTKTNPESKEIKNTHLGIDLSTKEPVKLSSEEPQIRDRSRTSRRSLREKS